MSKKKTHEEFLKELSYKDHSIILLGKYSKGINTIDVKCKTCGKVWGMLPCNIKKGVGYRSCKLRGNKHSKGKPSITHDEFVKILHKKRPDITLLDHYTSMKDKVNFKGECGHVWKTKPSYIVHAGTGCPICNEYVGERLVRELLIEHGIKFNSQQTFEGLRYQNLLELDFYMPDINTAIEVDGRQHREPIDRFGGTESFTLQKIRDSIKNTYCKTNNIHLIRLIYHKDKRKEFQKELDNLKKHLHASEAKHVGV